MNGKKRKIKLNKKYTTSKGNSIDTNIINNEKKLEEKILIQLNKLNYALNKSKLTDLLELAGNPKRFIIRNFTSGIAKGIGAGIGFSIITAIIIYFIQKLIKLNIPGISQYIADIVEIVKLNK